MRRSILTIFGIIIMCAALMPTNIALAAVNENFDGVGDFAVLDGYVTPGVLSYSSGGEWIGLPASWSACNSTVSIVDQSFVANNPLTITFDGMQGDYTFDYYALEGNGTLQVEGYLSGVLVFTDSYATNTVCDATFGDETAGTVGGTRPAFDQIVIVQTGGTALTPFIDNLVTADYVATAVTVLNVPHVTDIRIDAWQQVVAYDSPSGEPAKLLNGTIIVLPQDYDGNGFDTYIVTDSTTIDGETWYSIFLGNESFVWVKGSEVTLISS